MSRHLRCFQRRNKTHHKSHNNYNKEVESHKKRNHKFLNHEKNWSNDEVRRLFALYNSGKSIDEISKRLKRMDEAIVFRLLKEDMISIQKAKKLIPNRDITDFIQTVRKRNYNNRRRSFRRR